MAAKALAYERIYPARFKLLVFVPIAASKPLRRPKGRLLGDRHEVAFLLDRRAPKR
jgi:hypothetical protein